MTAAALWMGPSHAEGRALFARAREAGLSPLRALVLGQVGSFRDCWAFRSTIAEFVGCSVRTVQRALTQGASEGLIGKARAKREEKPPNHDKPMPCGWSHRWTVGWGLAGTAIKAAVDAARARWIVRRALGDPPKRPEAASAAADPSVGTTSRLGRPTRPEYQRRRWTPDELDAELERVERRTRPPPD